MSAYILYHKAIIFTWILLLDQSYLFAHLFPQFMRPKRLQTLQILRQKDFRKCLLLSQKGNSYLGMPISDTNKTGKQSVL
jgi:hypothetical protein